MYFSIISQQLIWLNHKTEKPSSCLPFPIWSKRICPLRFSSSNFWLFSTLSFSITYKVNPKRIQFQRGSFFLTSSPPPGNTYFPASTQNTLHFPWVQHLLRCMLVLFVLKTDAKGVSSHKYQASKRLVHHHTRNKIVKRGDDPAMWNQILGH